MAVTHTTAVRNGLADYVADAHDAGGGTSRLEIRTSSTILVTFNFLNPAFGAASGGVASLLGVPINANAGAGGVADNFVTRDRNGTQILAGSVTATGMGGDIEVSNTNIANGQACTLSSMTYQAPA